jgi:HK97 family phage prohead protease
MQYKYIPGGVVQDASLGARQIRVVANSGKSDRAKDVLLARGCVLDNYLRNPIVLADHDPGQPIGNFVPSIASDQLAGIVTFAPEGLSKKADEYCAFYKAGIMRAVSVGFKAIEYKPIETGGYLYTKWELMELSAVAVPCDPDAIVTARGVKVGREISAANAARLQEAHDHAAKCREIVAGVLGGQQPDQELALDAEHRKRIADALKLASPPLTAEEERELRLREVAALDECTLPEGLSPFGVLDYATQSQFRKFIEDKFGTFKLRHAEQNAGLAASLYKTWLAETRQRRSSEGFMSPFGSINPALEAQFRGWLKSRYDDFEVRRIEADASRAARLFDVMQLEVSGRYA